MSVTTRSTNPKIMDDNVAKLEKYMEENAALPEVSASDNGSALQVVNGAWGVGELIPGVVNALDSTSTTNALSAAQGKELNNKLVFENLASIQMGTNFDDHRLYILAFENAEKTNYLRVDFQTDTLRFRYFVGGVQQFERYANMQTPT